MANASEFFESLGKSISRTADKVVKKTDEFISIQRIKAQISAYEQKINNNFKKIGQSIYEKNTGGEEFSEEIDSLCQEITCLRTEIAACREEIAKKKGAKICPVCGTSVPKNARFCLQCGAPIDEERAEENEEMDDIDDIGEEMDLKDDAEQSADDGTAEEETEMPEADAEDLL